MSLPAETVKVLDQAERFLVYSLEPLEELPRHEHSTETHFHGYPVLGKAELTDANERAQLLGDFYQGVKDARGAVGNCFAPRHGISATLGDDTVDLVICFECWTVLTFAKHGRDVGVTDLPQAAFNRVLEREKIPIAK
jgi:hypothetical protein